MLEEELPMYLLKKSTEMTEPVVVAPPKVGTNPHLKTPRKVGPGAGVTSNNDIQFQRPLLDSTLPLNQLLLKAEYWN
jgi:hypothetical protein